MDDNIGKIVNNGFNLAKQDRSLTDLALLSLKIAVKAYFSTYHCMRTRFDRFVDTDFTDEGTSLDSFHTNSYCENCSETLIHFQHFAELVCKNILREEHQLLAVDINNEHHILYKLLKNEEITIEEQEKLYSIEFSVALERLCTLIKEGKFPQEKWSFILEYREVLNKLNKLRNRLWHRGIFVLRYPALDEFVGRYIFPFIMKVVELPSYSESKSLWKYNSLSCGIDPIAEIINVFTDKYDINKAAILKELGSVGASLKRRNSL